LAIDAIDVVVVVVAVSIASAHPAAHKLEDKTL